MVSKNCSASLEQMERIQKLHRHIIDHCRVYTFDYESIYQNLFEKIANASTVLLLNAKRFSLNKEKTIELYGADINYNDIEDILKFIANKFFEIKFPREIFDDIFKRLCEYNIYPYFLLRDNKQELEIFGNYESPFL